MVKNDLTGRGTCEVILKAFFITLLKTSST